MQMIPTCDIVRQLERRLSLAHVDVKDEVVLLALVELFPPTSNSIDDLPHFEPLAVGG